MHAKTRKQLSALISYVLIFAVLFGSLRWTPKVSAQPTSYEDCIAAGNTPGECSGAFTPEDFLPPDNNFDPMKGPTAETFDTLNPLLIGNSPYAQQLSTPGGVISRLLTFAFPLAGLILFVMLTWGGAEVLLGAANKKSVDAGKQRLTSALVGFALLFSSYWIAQILEYIFGIVILG